jgi:AraC family transcriptional regulator of adaptative response/methylated-DNA-[protein]-cysteine methyltransferase
MSSQQDYERMAAAIQWIRDHYVEQPSVDDMARAAGLSGSRFARLFRRWAGVTPNQYLRVVTLGHARCHLSAGRSVLDTALETGLSSPGRVHDLFVDLEAVTPGQFGRRGNGLTIRHGRHESPFGDCLLAATPRGICHLAFLDGTSTETGLETLARAWPGAELVHDPGFTAPLAAAAFGAAPRQELTVTVRGSRFQLRVWRALLGLPAGQTIGYGALADKVGQSGAARAVGSAVGSNPVAWLIPCHRVLRADGGLGGYRWGCRRKQAMLDWEALRTGESPRGAVARG